jgi:hypothetical protein
MPSPDDAPARALDAARNRPTSRQTERRRMPTLQPKRKPARSRTTKRVAARKELRQRQWSKRRAWRRIVLTPDNLERMRRLYEETSQSQLAIAAEFDMSASTLRVKAREHGWTRYGSQPLDVSPALRLEADVERAMQMRASLSLPPRGGGEGIGGSRLPSTSHICAAAREASDDGPGRASSPGIANSAQPEALVPPTPNPSPPSAAQMGGGENSSEDASAQTWESLLRQVQALIDMVDAARVQMQQTGEFRKAAQLARDVASLTTTLQRLMIMRPGTTHSPIQTHANDFSDDTASDLDARRDALARRIETILAEWMDAEAAGGTSSGSPHAHGD